MVKNILFMSLRVDDNIRTGKNGYDILDITNLALSETR